MAGKDDGKRPIIIKKIKKGGHGHHGGAWKVAYADFVTAMMAFFLLLWLLSSASKETLQGLSEYFTPTQGIKDEQGIGFDGGATATTQGIARDNKSQPGLVSGRTPTGAQADNPDNQAKDDGQSDDNMFKQGEAAVQQAMTQDAQMAQYAENISVSQTPEGLRIDITDSDQYAMFDPKSANLTVHGQTLLTRIGEIIKKMPNLMAIYGHTDASPVEAGNANYTNWELSADRAQAARRFMLKNGMEPERPKKIIGMADKELFTPKEPRGPKNRRISLVMLRGSHLLIPDAGVPGGLPPGSPMPVTIPPVAGEVPVPAPAAEAPAATAPAEGGH